MKTHDTFHFPRFAMLCKQNLYHHHRLILTAILGFCGALFLLLLFIQAVDGFHTFYSKDAFYTFVSVFCVTGILYTGTAFPGLRSREKAHQYLMIPASSFEKFLLEIVLRIVLFLLVVPLLYWVVYNLEGNVVRLFDPEFSFERLSDYPVVPRNVEVKNLETLFFSFLIGLTSVILLIPFTGATTFVKMPFLKTLFAVAIIFFFNLFVVVVVFQRILEFRQYYATSNGGILSFNQGQMFRFLVACFAVTTAGLLAASYLKIKEKEV